MLQFIRFPNLVIIALTQYLVRFCVIGTAIDTFQVSEWAFFLMVLMTVIIAAGGYIINDIRDYSIDLINKPDKVFIEKLLTQAQALRLYQILNLIGLLLGVSLFILLKWWGALIYPIIAIVALNVYANHLKKQAFWGNFSVATLCALIPLMVLGIEQLEFNLTISIQYILYIYALFAFISTFYREIIKDIEDAEGDEKYGSKTLPIIWGIPKVTQFAKGIGWVFQILVVIIIILAWQQGDWLSSLYISFLILLPIIWTLLKLQKATTITDFGKISKAIKGIMFTGLMYLVLYYFKV